MPCTLPTALLVVNFGEDTEMERESAVALFDALRAELVRVLGPEDQARILPMLNKLLVNILSDHPGTRP